jgi:hypothetical protein
MKGRTWWGATGSLLVVTACGGQATLDGGATTGGANATGGVSLGGGVTDAGETRRGRAGGGGLREPGTGGGVLVGGAPAGGRVALGGSAGALLGAAGSATTGGADGTGARVAMGGSGGAGGTGGRAVTGGSGGAGGTGGRAVTGGRGGAGGTGASGGGECLESGDIVLTEATNYVFSSTLTTASVVVRDNTNLLIDWSELTVDFTGAPIEPGGIDLVLVSLWGLTPSELQDAINRDALALADNKGAFTYYPTGSETSASLLDFNVFGNPLPEDELWSRLDTADPNFQYPPATHTWLVTVNSGTTPGQDQRMMTFFTLDPSSDDTSILLTNDSTLLDWSVNLADIPPVRVPAGQPALSIDWSDMVVNALGDPFDGTQITKVVVAHFPRETPAELEPDFLSLEDQADAWFTGEVLAGTSFELHELIGATGAPFAGIDASGVWLVAVFCSSICHNPAPWAISWIVPC